MDNNSNNEINLVKEIYKEVLIHSKEVGEIKTDLREHMRRTAVAEAKITGIERQVYMVHGALGLLSIAATVVAILKYFN